MDFARSHYYRVNRMLLTGLGLWPYRTRCAKYIHVIFLSPLIFSGIIVQFSAFITKEFSVDLFLNVVSLGGPTIYYVFIYFDTLLNADYITKFIEQMRCDLNSLKDEEEFKIVQKHAKIARFYTLIWITIMYTTIPLFLLIFFSPNILDIVMPLNESRRLRQLPTSIEYFIDQEKYIYLITFYLCLVGFVGVSILIATETLYMIYIRHTCALFQITSYRVECIVNRNQINSLNFSERSKVSCKIIIEAIDTHRRAFMYVETFKSTFASVHVVAIPIGVGSLSINLYRLSECALARDIGTISIAFVYVTIHFGFMFFANYSGQIIIDYSENVFKNICSTRWYATPLNIQKCLLMMIRRSMKTSTLIVGSIYVPSFEGIATLTSAALSYFMVLYSSRQPYMIETQ